ncbi:L-cystine import ATP-binding protein TcyN [Ewingella americana]|uniref:L-cystine import ATP-binding protein TcyN n=1 Tax=Ewingella americana TaxID=41202 RepID=A0A377NGQ1_9GAMM|nr:L-cystine import ATP-binding protein TcyN [Ewingella americana]
MIEIDNLHKQYGAPGGKVVEVLKGISLTVPNASITAVVGPSGAGNPRWRSASACWKSRPPAAFASMAKTCRGSPGNPAPRTSRHWHGVSVLGAAATQNRVGKYRAALEWLGVVRATSSATSANCWTASA